MTEPTTTRTTLAPTAVTWIPPFQDGDSTLDEWYVRVRGEDVFPDMAIGRLTVRTPLEADQVADKLISYDREPETGPWQSRVLLVADDVVNPSDRETLETFFIAGTEFVARAYLPHSWIRSNTTSAASPSRDRPSRELGTSLSACLMKERSSSPTSVMAIRTWLAHEQMFVLTRDASALRNGGRLPLMYTAASQVGVFDSPLRDSMPEVLLKKADGGVIGMISATRVGFQNSNMVLARSFHNHLFNKGRTPPIPVGLALMKAKSTSTAATERGERNVQRYSLFGDPATRLAIPRYHVEMQLADT